MKEKLLIVDHEPAIRRLIRRFKPKCLAESDSVTEVGLLSSAVVHDLNNTCSAAVALTDIALKEELSARTREDLSDIRRAAVQGKTILDNFAVLTRRARLPMSACDVHRLIRSALKSLRDDLARKNMRFDLSMVQEEPVVMGHRTFLLRMILILMNKAVDGTESGGAAVLRTELMSRPGYRMPLVRVIMEDFGPGIPAETVERMFKPLAVTGACQDTAGMELYLSSAIALQHRGRLSVENKPEGGARFTFYLPVIGLNKSVEPADGGA